MENLDKVLDRLDEELPQALDRLMAFLRIPSISTDPANKADVRHAAEWLAGDLKHLGFDVAVRETPGHPIVVAHSGPSDGKTVLFYGHYDVQPVDPLELWDRPPFDPEIQDTPQGPVIRARGASDDKGQVMTFIETLRAWKAVNGTLPGGITLLIEGEEEEGSPNLRPFLKANRDELRASIALICDTSLYSDGRPAITTQLRGLYGEEITLRAADRDLHSGSFGGLAANPLQILCNAFAGLKDENGRITLPGFYDGVEELAPALAKDWQALGFDAADFLGQIGLKHPIGEKGRTPLEMVWNQPTFEINGMAGGYIGDGFKTVLPGTAIAKVSFRLTGTQNPDLIKQAFRAYMQDFVPEDCQISFTTHGGSPAGRMDISDPAFAKAKDALTQEWGREAAYIGSGGSIPVGVDFKEILGMDSLFVGFAHDDDRIHSPNEKYDVKSFSKGARSWARILAALL